MNVRIGCLTAVLLAVTTGISTAQTTEVPKPVIRIALLLDTSNSMDGLIDQAKAQLWKMVNEFITMRRNGQRPEIRVALFE